jgi:hypothetical protein
LRTQRCVISTLLQLPPQITPQSKVRLELSPWTRI